MEYRIKEHRQKANLTQQELADRVGCSRQYLSEIETTTNGNVSSKLLVKIANELKVKVDDLFY